jgi:hypothetical protein
LVEPPIVECLFEFFGKFFSEAKAVAWVNVIITSNRKNRFNSSCGGRCIPTNSRQTVLFSPPIFSMCSRERFPTPKVKISDAKIGAFREFQRFYQRWEQMRFNVVKNARHSALELILLLM